MVSWILGGGWLIILGAFFIAIGGVWTTQGWRNLNARADKKALIIAVAQECLVTQDSLSYPPITMSDEFKDIGSRHYYYPYLLTTAMDEAIRSRHFNLDDQNERRFVRLMKDYVNSAAATNQYFRMLDSRLMDTKRTKEYRLRRYREVREGDSLQQFSNIFNNLVQHLEICYPGMLREAEKLLHPDSR